MKIYFERTGGFTGQHISTMVDTNQIPPEQAVGLLEKLDEADFFCLPERTNSGLEGLSGADQLCYKITVEVAGVQRTVETSESGAPEELIPLLDELNQFARTAHRPSGNVAERASDHR